MADSGSGSRRDGFLVDQVADLLSRVAFPALVALILLIEFEPRIDQLHTDSVRVQDELAGVVRACQRQ